jgi:hypothetical protein
MDWEVLNQGTSPKGDPKGVAKWNEKRASVWSAKDFFSIERGSFSIKTPVESFFSYIFQKLPS